MGRAPNARPLPWGYRQRLDSRPAYGFERRWAPPCKAAFRPPVPDPRSQAALRHHAGGQQAWRSGAFRGLPVPAAPASLFRPFPAFSGTIFSAPLPFPAGTCRRAARWGGARPCAGAAGEHAPQRAPAFPSRLPAFPPARPIRRNPRPSTGTRPPCSPGSYGPAGRQHQSAPAPFAAPPAPARGPFPSSAARFFVAALFFIAPLSSSCRPPTAAAASRPLPPAGKFL